MWILPFENAANAEKWCPRRAVRNNNVITSRIRHYLPKLPGQNKPHRRMWKHYKIKSLDVHLTRALIMSQTVEGEVTIGTW